MWMFPMGFMVLGAGMLSGQDYPNKPVRILGGAAGGGGDFVARQLAQGISGPLGQPVIVDNRSTAFLAAEVLSKSPPDGYALFIGGNAIWIGPLLQKMPYDVANDFSPISQLVREVKVLVVHPSLPVRSVKELIALAKAKPGALNYGAVGIGSGSHIGTELFKSMAGVNIVRVPFKGGATTIAALLSGEVQMVIADLGLAMPHVQSGKLRAVAVTSAEPSALVPGVPAVAASGLPAFESTGVTGIWAPAKTPAAIIKRLNQEIVRALNLPDAKEKFFNAGVEVVGSSPEQFAATIRSEVSSVGKVIKDVGIKVD